MQLKLLGAATIFDNGIQETLPLARPAWLLLYLALRADWVARDELACLFRPEDDEETARNALRLIFHRAKQFSWAQTLEIETKRAKFLIQTDVQEFVTHCTNKNWLEALALYKGSLVEGYIPPNLIGLEAWLMFEREHLHGLWREAVLQRTLELEQSREYPVAIAWLEKLLHAEPLSEAAVQALMRCHLALKNRSEAEKHFKRFSNGLQSEMGALPDDHTAALLRTDSQMQISEMPKRFLPLIGREAELEQLKTWLLGENRLVSIVGIGGTGKTRLALESARLLHPEFVHGTAFIDGSALSQANQLVSALAAALGIPSGQAQNLEQTVIAFLKEKSVLLVLDNMEHLLEAQGLLTQLLGKCENLRILVTTRIRLSMNEESILDLLGLPVPKNTLEIPTNQAIRLFLQVAQRLTKQPLEPDLIARVVQKLEGLPLAIELAARWTRVLSLPQIVTELEKSQLWLETDTTDVPERHRSLQTVLQSTWVQLTQREKQALEALSVFRGGASLEGLQAVGQTQLPTLLALMNKGLVRRDEHNRYSCHEMIREFALLQTQQLEQLQFLHWEFFYAPLEFEFGQPNFRPAELPGQFKNDLENLLIAWYLGYQSGNTNRIYEMVSHWVFVFEVNGWFQQALLALTDAIAFLRHRPHDKLLAHLLNAHAHFTFDKQQAKGYILECLEINLRLENTILVVQGYADLGVIEQKSGNFSAALGYFEQSEALATTFKEYQVGIFDEFFQELHRLLGNYDQARYFANRYTQKALSDNAPERIGRGNQMLGLLFQAEHQYQSAEQHFRISLEHFQKLGFQEGVASCLGNIAIVQISQNCLADARKTILETIHLKEQLERPTFTEQISLGNILLEENEPLLAFEKTLAACFLALQNHENVIAFDALRVMALSLYRLQQSLGKEMLLQILSNPGAAAETKEATLKIWHSIETREPWEVELVSVSDLLLRIKSVQHLTPVLQIAAPT